MVYNILPDVKKSFQNILGFHFHIHQTNIHEEHQYDPTYSHGSQ